MCCKRIATKNVYRKKIVFHLHASFFFFAIKYSFVFCSIFLNWKIACKTIATV